MEVGRPGASLIADPPGDAAVAEPSRAVGPCPALPLPVPPPYAMRSRAALFSLAVAVATVMWVPIEAPDYELAGNGFGWGFNWGNYWG